MLLSRDRIDEDTWAEFEEDLITSDLGVAPAIELVTALRTRLRVEGVSDLAQAKAILRAGADQADRPHAGPDGARGPAGASGGGARGRGQRNR